MSKIDLGDIQPEGGQNENDAGPDAAPNVAPADVVVELGEVKSNPKNSKASENDLDQSLGSHRSMETNRNMIKRKHTFVVSAEEDKLKNLIQAEEMFVEKTVWEQALEMQVLYFMPFWQGAASRMPFVYIVVQLVKFKLSWLQIGAYIASYQFCRTLASILSNWFPKGMHFVGTFLAFLGYLSGVFLEESQVHMFALGTVAVGFCETLACMQIYMKELFNTNQKDLGQKMHVQYTSVILGSSFGFFMGGIFYDNWGTKGAGLIGAIYMFFELIGVIHYIFAMRNGGIEDQIPVEDFDNEGKEGGDVESKNYEGGNNEGGSAALKKQGTLQRMVTMSKQKKTGAVKRTVTMSKLRDVKSDAFKTILAKSFAVINEQPIEKAYQSLQILTSELINTNQSKVKPNWINYLIAFSVGIEAIPIGYALAIGPIFILTKFTDQDLSVIGVLYGTGAGLAGVTTWLSKRLNDNESYYQMLQKYKMNSPYDCFLLILIVGVLTLIMAFVNFWVFAVAMVLMSIFNDNASLRLNRMQGQVSASVQSYKRIAPMGQSIRRFLNCFTAFSGPVLWSIWPESPFIIAFIVVIIMTGSLMLAFKLRENKIRKMMLDDLELSPDCMVMKVMKYKQMEVIAQIIEALDQN